MIITLINSIGWCLGCVKRQMWVFCNSCEQFSTFREIKRLRPLKSLSWSCENYSQGGSCHENLLSLHHGWDPGPMKMVSLVPWWLADASVCVCTALPSATKRCWPQPNLTCMLCTRGEDVTVRPLFCFEGNVLLFSASVVIPNLHLQGIKHEGITLIIISCLKQ